MAKPIARCLCSSLRFWEYAEADSRIQATFSQSLATRDLPRSLYAQDYARLLVYLAKLQRVFCHSLTAWRKWQRREERGWEIAEETGAEWQDASDLKTHKTPHFNSSQTLSRLLLGSFLPNERNYPYTTIQGFDIFFIFHICIIFTRRTQGIEDVLWISVHPLYGNLSHHQCFKKRWVSTETQWPGCLMTFPGIRWGQPRNERLL